LIHFLIVILEIAQGVAVIYPFSIPHEVSIFDVIRILEPLGEALLIITHPTGGEGGTEAIEGKIGTFGTETSTVDRVALYALEGTEQLFA